MSILGQLKKAPRFTLRRHQIARVVCQVRFSPVLRLREQDSLIPFQEAIRQRYPDFGIQRSVNLILTPDGVSQQERPDPHWQFANKEEGYSAVLTTDFLALETTKYVDVEDLCGRLCELLDQVQEHFAPAKTTRTGLRFINELRFSEAQLPEAILNALNPTMLGVAAAEEFAEVTEATREIIELSTDSSNFAIRHGLHRGGGTTVEPVGPEPPDSRPFYLIDLDAYSAAELSFSTDGIDERVRLFNDQIRSFFAWAVNEEFRREALGQEDVDE